MEVKNALLVNPDIVTCPICQDKVDKNDPEAYCGNKKCPYRRK